MRRPPPLKPALVAVLLGGAALRLIAAALIPPLHDETYYWLWARHLALGYGDHPPMVAYLVYLATRLGDAPLFIRLPALLLGTATSYILFLLTRDVFGERPGLIAAGLSQVVPLLSLGGVLMLPDAPMLLAWALLLRLVWQALHGRPAVWAGAGLVAGLGLLSKLNVALLGVGIWLSLARTARPWLRRPEPYRATLIALLFFVPVVYWNATHGWVTLRFLLEGRSRIYPVPRGMPGVIVFSLPLVLAGLLLPAYLWSFWVVWRHRADARFAYIFWTTLPTALVALAGAPLAISRGHWLAPVFLALTVVLAARWNRILSWLGIGTAVLSLLFAVQALHGLPVSLPGGRILQQYVNGYDEMTAQVRAEAAAIGPGTFVVTDRYQIAAQISYHTREFLPVLVIPLAGADVWEQPATFDGANAIGVTFLALPFYATTPLDAQRCFQRVEPLPPLTPAAGGRAAFTFRLMRLYGFSARCAGDFGAR